MPAAHGREFRSRSSVLVGSCFSLFSLLTLSGLTAAENTAQVLLALLAATLPGWIAVRCFRSAVSMDDEELVRRGYFRTQRVLVADIVDVELVPSWNWIWQVPELRTSDGKSVKLDEVAQLRSGGPASAFIDALSARLRSQT